MDISNLIFGLSKYNFIKYFSYFLSYIYIYLFPIVILFWVFIYRTKKVYTLLIILFSAVSTFLVSELIKNITKIQRPAIEGLMVSERGFSFPSEHSSITMVIGIVIYSIDKKLGIIFIALSILVGLSRVILGVHYIIDVLAGWGVGILIGLIFIKIFKNI